MSAPLPHVRTVRPGRPQLPSNPPHPFRERDPKYSEKDSQQRERERARRRRRSYSPMRKRRRDSPSHLEARRITRSGQEAGGPTFTLTPPRFPPVRASGSPRASWELDFRIMGGRDPLYSQPLIFRSAQNLRDKTASSRIPRGLQEGGGSGAGPKPGWGGVEWGDWWGQP